MVTKYVSPDGVNSVYFGRRSRGGAGTEGGGWEARSEGGGGGVFLEPTR